MKVPGGDSWKSLVLGSHPGASQHDAVSSFAINFSGGGGYSGHFLAS